MSQAEDLLNSLSDGGIAAYSANSQEEEHIVIGEDRIISVPEALQRIAVQFDHDIETVIFDCPRYWDEHDMSVMKIYINYMRPDGTIGMYWSKNVYVDADDPTIMHFDWTISKNVSLIKGKLSFLVCAKKTDSDGNEESHWNSELCKDMYISEGLECSEQIIQNYPDIITDLLTRMDYVEYIATPETMQNYVYKFLRETTELKDCVYRYLDEHGATTPEQMLGYVQHYLSEHPPLLVIGPEEPGVRCVWFNTGSGGQTVKNTIVKLTADDPKDCAYVEVNGTTTTEYDYEII